VSSHCIGELILGLGQLALALVGFLLLVRYIELPEKGIRAILHRLRSKKKEPPTSSEAPHWHDRFDEPT
jgi:hypothetical protein